MAEINSTCTAGGAERADSEARIAGAQACVRALRMFEVAANTIEESGDTAEEYFDKCLADSNALADGLGPMPARVNGIIVALAEYIHTSNTAGLPNLGQWRPMSAMTKAERQAMIERMENDQAGIIKQGATA